MGSLNHSQPETTLSCFLERRVLFRNEVRLRLSCAGLFEIGPDGSSCVHQLIQQPPQNEILEKYRSAEVHDVDRELKTPHAQVPRFRHTAHNSMTIAASNYPYSREPVLRTWQFLRFIRRVRAARSALFAISHFPFTISL